MKFTFRKSIQTELGFFQKIKNLELKIYSYRLSG